MEFYVVSKSTTGWIIKLDEDVLAEFSDVNEARSYAHEFCEVARAAGRAAQVLDLSYADRARR